MNNFSKKAMCVLLSVVMLATSFMGIGNVFAKGTDDLAGKTLLFAGDSISAGYKDEANADASLKAWAKRLADNYSMEVTLAAQSGSPLSTIREPDRPAIVNQLHENKGGSFDYVILQGGVNDAMGTATDNSKEAAAPVGEMSNSFVNYAFDTSTFAGALENLFYYAKSYFSEAKVGYIITFATPLSTHGGYTADTDSMRLYWNMAKAICEKWGVSYLDLFDGTTEDGQSYSYDILKVDTATNFYGGGYDYIHLNSMGYDLTAPYVAKWLPTTTAITYDDSSETFQGGSGTEADPYIITNETELALAITNGGEGERFFGCHFSIANDIYLNDIDAVDWSTGTANGVYTLKPWYSQDETFAGTINGNGHTVYGLYSYAGGTIKYMNHTIGSGLIPATDSAGTATIKNLGIDYSYVRQRYCAGAFVGLCGKSVVIDNCFVGPNTKIIGCHAGAIVGNGYQKTVTITNSYSLAEFEVQAANDYSYGLIGYANQAKATVDNCYIVNGPITSTGGTNDNSVFKFSSSYQTADSGSGGSQSEHTDIYTLTAYSMQGEDVFTNESKMPCLNSDNAYLATKGYPILISFNKGDVLEGPWDGSIEKPTALDGNGNILISTAAELAYVIKNGGGASYVLSNDIYLNDISAINWYTGEVAKGYTPAKWYTTDTSTAFTGTIDGKGYVVYGLYFANGIPAPTGSENYTRDAVALIPRMSDNGTSTVKNLGIDYAYIKGSQCAAAFVGNSNGAALKTVDSCFAGEKVTVIGHVAGGIFGGGDSELSVNNCYSLATLGATYSSGGLFGNVWSYNYTINEEETYTKQTVNNSYSFNFRPFTVTDGVVAENVYTNVSVTCDYYSVLTDDNMTGADAFENMGGFDGKIWYAVNNGQTTPLLRVHGTAVGDVDEDGVGKRAGDILALRTTIIGAQSYLNTDYNGNGETDICDLVKLNNDGCKDKESSVIKNKLEIPLNINTYRDASGSIGETITISGPTGPWNYASFNVETGATYGVKFYAYPSAESWPHIFLCNGEDVILNTISAEYAGRNYITFTVTDNQITKVYVRSRTNNGEKEKIKVTQNIEGIDLVNMDILGQLKFEIAPPKNYTAWPMVEEVNGKLVCLYTEADQHSFTECKLYMKTSSTNGLTWSEAKEIITEDSGARGITGTGNDSQGNMLIWYMNRNKDWSTKHTLYKTDGNTVTKVCAPDFSFTGGGHIGNIFSVPGEGLFAFYNTYGNTRSWGVVKSVDDGLTWEQIPVEENIESAECPVEIDGFYHDGKILALGRKDKNSGTIAMFQIQSSDNGANWTKEYTNITEDALGNSPSIIFDGETEDIYMYYFDRNTGKLKRRTATFTGVWDNPAGWSEATVIVSEPYSGQDTGNVKTVEINGMHFATYYVGTATDTGVYGLLIKP